MTDQKASKVAALLDSGVSDVYLSAEIVRRLCLKPSGPLVKVMSSFDSASIVLDGFVTYTIKMAVQIAYFNACLCLDNSFISLAG